MKEATYKLRPGSTASDLDELDADLSRMKILGKPNFSKLTYTIDKTKLSFQKARHLDMLMKQKKTRKIESVMVKESKKLSDKEQYDYILYIKKYKPDIWRDLQGNKNVRRLINKFESVNEAGMELKKIKDAILMFKKKIEKQGRITNARDAEHLKKLIKVYKQMGGKSINENGRAIMKSISNAKKGAIAKGGGYAPFVKMGKNFWKQPKTNTKTHDDGLFDKIGGFKDFIIK
tara:strand:- start:3947 stop:4642 length:696 start_codon:yes stop_codon:yes gene_type:complete